MKLILIGCEYSGTTTLALAINEWMKETTGTDTRLIHDHWKIPHTSGHLPDVDSHFLTREEQAQILALSPKLKEMHQRHSLYYHTPHSPNTENSLIIGYHFDDSVYGQLYFEYGRPTDPEDRRLVTPRVEKTMLGNAPETVLILVKASPDDISARMKEHPHENGVLNVEDIEFVVDRFDEEFKYSMVSKKITLDTTSVSVEDSILEFAEKIQPHLSDVDRSRMQHQALRSTS